MRLGISLDGAKAADWAAVYIARHGWHCDMLFCPHCPHNRSAVLWHSGQTCRRCRGEAHPASTSGCSRLSWSCRWRPRSADGTPFSQPPHEVEQSRGPVQEKQERLASVEVEANEQFVLSTMWSATESSPGGPTRKPWIVRSTSQFQGSSWSSAQLTDMFFGTKRSSAVLFKG